MKVERMKFIIVLVVMALPVSLLSKDVECGCSSVMENAIGFFDVSHTGDGDCCNPAGMVEVEKWYCDAEGNSVYDNTVL